MAWPTLTLMLQSAFNTMVAVAQRQSATLWMWMLGGRKPSAPPPALGGVVAGRGWRVLLIALDPQASLTSFCGVESTAGASLAEVLGGALPGPVAMWDILREVIPGMYLFLAPADLAMASTELGLGSRIGREIVQIGRAHV